MPPGTYDLKIEARPQYLFASVQAKSIDAETVVSYMSEILDVFDRKMYFRLLLKKDIPDALELDDYATVANWVTAKGLKGIKIAIVDEVPDHADINRKGESAARKIGLNIRFFNRSSPAIHWLLFE